MFRFETVNYPEQFTNIAFVFPMLSSRLFVEQNSKKWFNTSYRTTGDGAIRTKSSANASKISYNDASVNACLLLPSILCSL